MDPGARGLALAGLILGYINIILLVVVIAAALLFSPGPGQVSPFIYMK
jgi:hypothetical protein